MIKGNLSKTYQGEGPAAEALLENIAKHLGAAKTENPHGVTAEQVGAYSKEEVDKKLNDEFFTKADIVNREHNLRAEWEGDIQTERNATQAGFNTITNVFLPKKADVEYVDDKIAEVVGGAPEALDTLKEISEALKENDDVTGELIKQIANRYTKEEVGELLGKKTTVTETDRKIYAVPSLGLEIENGAVIGIGTCTDEHIVIPEFDNSGNPVTSVASDVFGSLLGDNGGFIKSIVFPPSISWFGERLMLPISVINTTYCPNLESVYLMNPKIGWEEGVSPFKFENNVKDVYFGGSRKQWIELNTERESPAIQLRPENISAGIVPTIHYGFFAPTSEIERLDSQIGDIDTALDELHNYAEALKSGGEA